MITYRSNDRQAIFDTVARHLAAQGFRAITNSRCDYRGPRGERCAAGVLIPDDEYSSAMEANVFRRLDIAAFAPHADLIDRLQLLHDTDDSWTPDNMPRELRAVAQLYHVDPAILDRLDFGTILPDRLD